MPCKSPIVAPPNPKITAIKVSSGRLAGKADNYTDRRQNHARAKCLLYKHALQLCSVCVGGLLVSRCVNNPRPSVTIWYCNVRHVFLPPHDSPINRSSSTTEKRQGRVCTQVATHRHRLARPCDRQHCHPQGDGDQPSIEIQRCSRRGPTAQFPDRALEHEELEKARRTFSSQCACPVP